ncbi:MAG: MFS transporter, partial [Propionibacteriaceae bacterium]|nr:MFS transporter [Propionibacteriaceae bacterium]
MKETSKTTTIDVSHTGELKEYPVYSHKMIMEVLSGLMISMFASNIASTIVTNALPVISSNLGSSQHEYTWIVTSTLLASTATTPIWGKLADMFNKRKLLLA